MITGCFISFFELRSFGCRLARHEHAPGNHAWLLAGGIGTWNPVADRFQAAQVGERKSTSDHIDPSGASIHCIRWEDFNSIVPFQRRANRRSLRADMYLPCVREGLAIVRHGQVSEYLQSREGGKAR